MKSILLFVKLLLHINTSYSSQQYHNRLLQLRLIDFFLHLVKKAKTKNSIEDNYKSKTLTLWQTFLRYNSFHTKMRFTHEQDPLGPPTWVSCMVTYHRPLRSTWSLSARHTSFTLQYNKGWSYMSITKCLLKCAAHLNFQNTCCGFKSLTFHLPPLLFLSPPPNPLAIWMFASDTKRTSRSAKMTLTWPILRYNNY